MGKRIGAVLLVMLVLIPANASNSRVYKVVKAATCQVQGEFPDPNCTPGAVLDVSAEQVCVKGYTQTVRHVTTSTKNEVYQEYGIASHKKGEYEVDHFIPLELGGSSDIHNLWPEPADPKPGFHEKDRVENYLHLRVCLGKISLEEAQKQIRENWLEVYRKIDK